MRLAVSRQTAYKLTVNRQKSFFGVNRRECRLRVTVRNFQSISNLTISADLHGIVAPEESVNSRDYKILQPTYIWKYSESL